MKANYFKVSSKELYHDDFSAYVDGTNLGGQGLWVAAAYIVKVYNSGGEYSVLGGSNNKISFAYYNNTVSNDQWARAVMTNVLWNATYGDIGVAVRVSTGTDGTGYAYYGGGPNRYFSKTINGVETGLDWTDGAGGFSEGDVLELRVVGDTLTCLLNGQPDPILGTNGVFTDSSISTGYVGVMTWDNHPDIRLGKWVGGSL